MPTSPASQVRRKIALTEYVCTTLHLKMTMTHKIFPIAVFLLTVMSNGMSSAHNGQIALAHPLSGITVDGDFSDWPSDVHAYPLAQTSSSERGGAQTITRTSGQFRIGYDVIEHALYLAVETPIGWDHDVDKCHVFLETLHRDRGVYAVVYTLANGQITRNHRFRALPTDAVKAKKLLSKERVNYEWSIPVENLDLERIALQPGTTLAFDIELEGKHTGADERVYHAWGRGKRKHKYADRRGDLLIAGPIQNAGSISGRISLAHDIAPAGRRIFNQLVINSTTNDLIRLKGRWSDNGYFRYDLPAGRYNIFATMTRRDEGEYLESTGAVNIEPNRTTVTSLSMRTAAADDKALNAATSKAGPGSRDGRWHRFNVPDGLPSDEILALRLGHSGELWLGTNKGAVRFDGDNMQIFTDSEGLPDNVIRSIAVDPNGHVWFGTSKGLSRYDGASFRNFTRADGLPDEEIQHLFVDAAGDLYVSTARGLVQYNRNIMTRFTTSDGLPSHEVNCMYEDHLGRQWFGLNQGLCRFSNGIFDCVEDFDVPVLAIGEGPSGELWLCGPSPNDVFTFSDGRMREVAAPEKDAGYPESVTGHIDGVWIDYANTGDAVYSSFRYDGFSSESLQAITGFEVENTQTIGEDRQGNMWFSSDQGLISYDGSDYTLHPREEGAPHGRVNALHHSNEGSLWYATRGSGIARLQDGIFQHFDKDDGLASKWVYAIAEDGYGAIWFATASGANRFINDRFDQTPIRGGILNVAEDREANLWFHSRRDLTIYNHISVNILDEEEGIDESDPVIFFAIDKQGVPWFAQPDAGLVRYNGSQFVDPKQAPALRSLHVVSGSADQHDGIWLGNDDGVFHYDAVDRLYHYTTEDGLPSNKVAVVYEDSEGNVWVGTDKGAGYFAQGHFTLVLSNFDVTSIADGEADEIWFGTAQGQILFFDGETVNVVKSQTTSGSAPTRLAFDTEKNLWAGANNGLLRYEGDQLSTHLRGNAFQQIIEDPAGNLYFLSDDRISVSKDGETFTDITIPESAYPRDAIMDGDGTIWMGGDSAIYTIVQSEFDALPLQTLPSGRIRPIYADPKGGVWVVGGNELGLITEGQYRRQEIASESIVAIHRDVHGGFWMAEKDGSISRRANTHRSHYLIALIENGATHESTRIFFVEQDQSGNVWVGTNRGLGRFESGQFRTYTDVDGLGSNRISSMLETPQGEVWFGTDGGITEFVDGAITSYDQSDGLAYDKVNSISTDREGHLWIATHGGGVSQFDGLVFQSLRARDGLAHNVVHAIHQDRRGDLWFATQDGLTRYRPRVSQPTVSAWTDKSKTLYGLKSDGVYHLAEDVRFHFDGVSLKTRPDQIAYAYRLVGYSEEWTWTREHQVVYSDLPVGDYRFEVHAVDRDLNYSTAPAVVPIEVTFNLWIAISGSIVVIGMFATVYFAASNRRKLRRAEQARIQDMEDELNKAHDLQMGLLPPAFPEWDNIKVAALCRPAARVGGDIYQFFDDATARSCVLADVTGHGMSAAVPAMVFDGIIHTEITSAHSQESLFDRLNSLLYSRVNRRTFICCSMVSIDCEARSIRLINAGLPYPLHYKAKTDTVEEIALDAFPLALRESSQYTWYSVAVEPGDRLVLCSDGLIEIEDSTDTMFGFKGFADVIQNACSNNLSPQEIIDHTYEVVAAYDSAPEQMDDQTMIVIEIV